MSTYKIPDEGVAYGPRDGIDVPEGELFWNVVDGAAYVRRKGNSKLIGVVPIEDANLLCSRVDLRHVEAKPAEVEQNGQ
jgi:hypothetical protein